MNNLRNLRKKKGLSIPDLHRLTGYPVRTLEDWDSERRIIQSYHRIKKLSEILECTIDEFMTKEEIGIFKGEEVIVSMVQEEDGVHIQLVDSECEEISNGFTIIPREEALSMLKDIKNNKDISDYFKPYC